jgi:hypothetical protein
MPLLIAHQRGIKTLVCHHGALDGRYLFKRTNADVIIAKSRMEKDYLVRLCGLPPSRVVASRVDRLPSQEKERDPAEKINRPYIVYFSEGYEVGSGRAEEFYRDILPVTAKLAEDTGHSLVVKLHSAESLRDRSRLIRRILKPSQAAKVSIVSGVLTEKLLNKTWCAITVLSTAAVECASRGIPCFLCKWLDYWPYEYIDQFARFGAGVVLESPSDISRIAHLLEHYPSGLQEQLEPPSNQTVELLSRTPLFHSV